MVSSLKEVGPARWLELSDGTRLEVSLYEDCLWISEHVGDVCKYTLCIPRDADFTGTAEAPGAVQQVFEQRGKVMPAGKGGGARRRSRGQVAIEDRVSDHLRKAPPKKAGYWFTDPTIAPHGIPAVIVDP